MSRLIRTEFARFRGRRIVWITAGIAGAVILLAFGISFTQTSSEAPTDDGAVEQAAIATDDCLSYFESLTDEQFQRDFPEFDGFEQSEIDRRLREDYCFNDPVWFRGEDQRFFATELLTEGYAASSITDWSEQRPSSNRADDFTIGADRFRNASEGLVGILPAVATFSLVLSVIIGASFVGAEYKSGTVENLLLWEPRRGRVLTAKFVAGFVSSAVVTTVVLAWLAGLFLLLADLHGTTQGVDTRFWVDVISVILRAALVGGLFFVIAMSVAVIARNTTASVGLILGWFAVSNILIELLARNFRHWELFTNALAFISEANVPRYVRLRGEWLTVYAHDYLRGGLIALVWAMVMATLATWLFVRRDID
ncbi:MAG: ABC transporter permease subunit [Acidimicrobiales bacterium]